MVQFSSRGDAAFAALSDRTRRGILERLGRGDASTSDLAARFNMTLTGIKKHLRVLEAAELVTTEKVGRVRHCRLGPSRLDRETTWIEEYRQMLEARLDRLVEGLRQRTPVVARQAARVAAGAFAKLLLREFGTEIASHTIQIGHLRLDHPANWEEILAACADLDSPLRCVDRKLQEKMMAEVDAALKAGDTVGGVFEIVVHNVPVGLGSHAQWDEKLDGKLAQALMSVQAVKAVEIGSGILAAGSYGSEVQDEISYDKGAKKFRRSTNRAGGLEGGISNGEDLLIRGFLKPISTLRRGLVTADMVTKEPVQAAYERSDWCVVPAGGVAGEAMVALVLADAFLQKFGGDSLAEMRRNFEGYGKQIDNF